MVHTTGFYVGWCQKIICSSDGIISHKNSYHHKRIVIIKKITRIENTSTSRTSCVAHNENIEEHVMYALRANGFLVVGDCIETNNLIRTETTSIKRRRICIVINGSMCGSPLLDKHNGFGDIYSSDCATLSSSIEHRMKELTKKSYCNRENEQCE